MIQNYKDETNIIYNFKSLAILLEIDWLKSDECIYKKQKAFSYTLEKAFLKL